MSSKTHTLYRIYYGEEIVYLGRTNQPLQSRLRGHFFGRPMHRKMDLEQVSKVEYATFKTEADMYVYEVYFINLYKPLLNRDDLSRSELNVRLPEVDWQEFDIPLREKWMNEIEKRDSAYQRHQEQAEKLFQESLKARREQGREAYCDLRQQSKEMAQKPW